jgi:hypothetical protein
MPPATAAEKEALALPSIPRIDPVLLEQLALEEGWILGIGVPTCRP